MSVSSTLPPVRLNNQAYQKVTATVDARSGGPRSNRGIKTSGRCQPVINSPSRVVAAKGDHFHWSRGSGGPKSTGGQRGAGESAGGDGSPGPTRPVSGSSSDSSGPAHPSSRRRAGVVTVGHCKVRPELSDD